MLNAAQKKWVAKKIVELMKIYVRSEAKTSATERAEMWDQIGNQVNTWYSVTKAKNEEAAKDVSTALNAAVKFLDNIEKNLYSSDEKKEG